MYGAGCIKGNARPGVRHLGSRGPGSSSNEWIAWGRTEISYNMVFFAVSRLVAASTRHPLLREGRQRGEALAWWPWSGTNRAMVEPAQPPYGRTTADPSRHALHELSEALPKRLAWRGGWVGWLETKHRPVMYLAPRPRLGTGDRWAPWSCGRAGWNTSERGEKHHNDRPAWAEKELYG